MRAVALGIAQVLLLSGSCAIAMLPAAAQTKTSKKQKGSVIMQIKFARSGGFAGAATNVSGVVEFQDTGARVRSEKAGYEREVAPQEAEQIRNAAAAAINPQAKAAMKAPSSQRDAYQYDVTVVKQDGSTESLTFTGEKTADALQQVSPAAAHLISWVRQEAQQIWKQRAAARK
ncbi:MAG TPA: hypothetical protein VGF16_11200 [Bryobacteraceae bacterium]|jgi:hypothetical protein